MAKPDAWMPLYVADYLADTGRLTTEQHGAYFLLIIDYWRTGPLPDENAVLSRITGLSAAAWRKMRPIIEAFFQIRDGHWHHKRIDQEMEAAKKNANRRSEQASKAAAGRWNRDAGGNAARNAPSNAGSNARGIKNEDAESNAGGHPGAIPSPSPSPSSTQSNTNTESYQAPARPKSGDDAGLVYSRVEALLNAPKPLGMIEIRAWLRDGIPSDVIVDAIISVIEKKRQAEPDFIPNTMKYFDNAVRREFANRPPSLAKTEAADSPDERRKLLETYASIVKKGRRIPDITDAVLIEMHAAGLITEAELKQARAA